MEPIIHSVYIDPEADAWRMSGDTPDKATSTFAGKDEAITAGRAEAKKVHGQLVVRKANQIIEFAEDYASVER